MTDTDTDAGSGEPAGTVSRLELTPPELKITFVALKTYLNDFGHDEYDLQRLVRSVLDKLPPAAEIEAIDLGLPRRRPRL